eukprot:scaffold2661_cov120-Isochrysis_galbana.AAC.6
MQSSHPRTGPVRAFCLYLEYSVIKIVAQITRRESKVAAPRSARPKPARFTRPRTDRYYGVKGLQAGEGHVPEGYDQGSRGAAAAQTLGVGGMP